MDYPNVRASSVCPLCGKNKESGLIVCWICYREYDMRHGNPAAELRIEQAEDVLCASKK